MSLKIDSVTDWQKQILGEIERLRKLNLPAGDTNNYEGNPNDWLQSGPGDVQDHYDKHKGELGSSWKGPGGSSWGTHIGMGLGMIPGLGGIGEAFGLPDTGFDIPFSSPQNMLDNAERLAVGLATDYAFSFLRQGAVEHVQDRVNQELENRGYLEFKYPGMEGSEFVLPFFENPQIQESRSSRYSSHTIINRNEPWRLFTGAEAKKVNLTLKLTLPHMLHFAIAYGNENMLTFLQGSKYYSDFQFKVSEWIDKRDGYLSLSLKNEQGHPTTDAGERTWTPQSSQGLDLGYTSQQKEELFYAYVQHMVDKVRSSVVGSVAQKSATVKAPPVVFLQFGTMYHREPFIVRNYSVNYGGEQGYDVNTMLPRVMNIQLQLEGYSQIEEIPGGLQSKDRSTPEGWDSILREETDV